MIRVVGIFTVVSQYALELLRHVRSKIKTVMIISPGAVLGTERIGKIVEKRQKKKIFKSNT